MQVILQELKFVNTKRDILLYVMSNALCRRQQACQFNISTEISQAMSVS